MEKETIIQRYSNNKTDYILIKLRVCVAFRLFGRILTFFETRTFLVKYKAVIVD